MSIPLPFSVLQSGSSGEALQACYAARYAREAFIRVMPLSDPELLAHGFFDSQRCNQSNRVEIFVFASQTQAVLMACLDNLGKGASGAAVQNMNLHLGCDEAAGLSA